MKTTTISIYKRDSKAFTLRFKNSAGNAINITGYTIFFTVKKKETDTDANALIRKDVTSHTNAAGGVSAIALTSADTDIPAGNYTFDIQTKDGAGSVTTILKGTFNVVQDITTRS